jgi:hypothetical protein
MVPPATPADVPVPSPARPADVVPPTTGVWPLVGVSLLILAGTLVAVSALYGVVLALVADGRASAVGPGAGVGSLLSYAWFGVPVRAATSGSPPTLGFTARLLPLGGVALPVAATWMALEYAYRRLPHTRSALVGFVARLAGSFAALAAVVALVVDGASSGPGQGVDVDISAGPALLLGFLLVAATGAAFLHRRGIPLVENPSPATATDWWRRNRRSVLDGVRAWAAVAALMTVLVLLAGLIAADSGAERVLLLFATPALLVNLGAAGVTLAMGGAVGLGGPRASSLGLVPGRYVSLFHFGFPPRPADGAAPALVFLLLVLAPVAVGVAVWRRLRLHPSAAEQDALGVAFATALAFGATALVGAVVARLSVAASAAAMTPPTGSLVARPSIPASAVLALVWGVVGGVAAAELRTRRPPAQPRVPPVQVDPPDRPPPEVP